MRLVPPQGRASACQRPSHLVSSAQASPAAPAQLPTASKRPWEGLCAMAAPQCPVFNATHRDLQQHDFAAFVASKEPEFEAAGVCKIVPPRGWRPRKAGYSGVDFMITRCVALASSGRLGRGCRSCTAPGALQPGAFGAGGAMHALPPERCCCQPCTHAAAPSPHCFLPGPSGSTPPASRASTALFWWRTSHSASASSSELPRAGWRGRAWWGLNWVWRGCVPSGPGSPGVGGRGAVLLSGAACALTLTLMAHKHCRP